MTRDRPGKYHLYHEAVQATWLGLVVNLLLGCARAVHCFKMPSLAKSPPTCDAFRRSASAMLVTPMVRSKPIVAFRKAAITSGPERLRIRLASSPIVTSRT